MYGRVILLPLPQRCRSHAFDDVCTALVNPFTLDRVATPCFVELTGFYVSSKRTYITDDAWPEHETRPKAMTTSLRSTLFKRIDTMSDRNRLPRLVFEWNVEHSKQMLYLIGNSFNGFYKSFSSGQVLESDVFHRLVGILCHIEFCRLMLVDRAVAESQVGLIWIARGTLRKPWPIDFD